jgi:4'-phosphopantetheinyl transferase
MARSDDVIEVWRVELDAPGAARAALGTLLGGRVPQVDEYGKPWVDGGPHFNLSHTRDVALIAISHAREVGVDVERADRRAHAVLRSLTTGERELLGEAPTARALLQTWCRKEALAKAIGRGLNWQPQDFDTTAPGDYAIEDLDAGPEHVAALAVAGARPYSISPRRMPSATAAARSDTPSRS